MKNLQGVYLNKKGFSLIELILGICLSSILLMCFYSLLHYTMNISKIHDEKDTILTNGRYALLYIKDEIKNCDKIIDIKKFEGLDETYPENIGFVIMKITKDKYNKLIYKYFTYFLKNDILVRIGCEVNNPNYLPDQSDFSGHNTLCNKMDSLEKFNYNPDKNILKIKLSLNNGAKTLDFKSDIYLNCSVDLNCEEEDG